MSVKTILSICTFSYAIPAFRSDNLNRLISGQDRDLLDILEPPSLTEACQKESFSAVTTRQTPSNAKRKKQEEIEESVPPPVQVRAAEVISCSVERFNRIAQPVVVARRRAGLRRSALSQRQSTSAEAVDAIPSLSSATQFVRSSKTFQPPASSAPKPSQNVSALNIQPASNGFRSPMQKSFKSPLTEWYLPCPCLVNVAYVSAGQPNITAFLMPRCALPSRLQLRVHLRRK